ncbi:unnamed protein product [Musa acuminata subsp. burmannicoides]
MERSFARMDAAGRPGDTPPAPTCRCELQTPRCDHVGPLPWWPLWGPTGSTLPTAAIPAPSSATTAPPFPSPPTTSRTGRTSCGRSRQRAAGSSTGMAPGFSGSLPCREPSVSRVPPPSHVSSPRTPLCVRTWQCRDNYLKPYVISEPEVTVTERKGTSACSWRATGCGKW